MSCGFYALVTLILSLVIVPTVNSISWKTEPTDVSVRVDQDAVLMCEVNNRDDKIVTWNKGNTIAVGNQIISGDFLRYSIVGEFNLKIVNVTTADDGEFVCTVQDFTSGLANLNVLVPPGAPSLDVNVTRTDYHEGDSVSLTCISSGANPAPTFRWTRKIDGNKEDVPPSAILSENIQTKGQSSSQIVIALQPRDNGAEYMCEVFNNLNAANTLSTTHVFSVFYAPIISFPPAYPPFNILLGTLFNMECLVDANPSATSIVWRKGSSQLRMGSGTSLAYTFQSAQKTDTGEYSCTATNTINTRVLSTQLTVMYAPIITVPPKYTVRKSDNLNMRCSVDANPPVTSIQWLKIDSSMGSSGRDLNLTNIDVSQMGNYSCIARNRLQLSNQVAREEERRGYSFLYVQYKPGDAFISPYSPVNVGEQLSLKCSVNNPGYPHPEFEWRRVETNSKLAQNAADLVIPQVSLSYIGNYSCAAVNLIGSGGSSVIQVDIYEPVSFKELPNPRETIHHNNTGFTMQCVVQGRPQPYIIWYKDGNRFDQDSDFYSVSTTVSLESAYRYVVTSRVSFLGSGRSSSRGTLLLQDIGNYTCLALSNATGTQQSHTKELLIFFPPQTDMDEKVAATANDTARLSCTVQGYPIPQFQWYKGGSLLSLGGRFIQEPTANIGVSKATNVLQITDVQNVDFGDYKCMVISPQGTAVKIITLAVKNKPEAPSALAVLSKTWESVYLRWIPGFNGGESQTFYIRYTSLPHSSHGANDVDVATADEYNVTGLMPETTYDFKVYGVNQLGQGNHSESIKVTTQRLTFPTIKSVPVFKVSEKSLTLDIDINVTYCVRIKVSRNGGTTWSTVIVKSVDCFDASQKSYSVLEDGINKLNISLCLLSRQEVCGAHVAAEIRQPSNPDLSATEVIAIGAVCAAILIVLLCVLVYFICRRRQNNAAKDYENSQNANRQTQPVNGNIPPKPKRGFDNPGMDTTEFTESYQLDGSRGMSGSTNMYSGLNHMNYPSRANNHNGSAPNGNIPLDTSYDSQLEKRLYENEMNRRNDNLNSEAYNKQTDSSFHGAPRRDQQQYIDLHPEDHKEGGSFGSGMESGYSTPDPSKPKKVIYEVVV
ncbi:nephrin-like isoform X2 [Mizuhopecten yessoensis]|uniref:nephrin-like isoform X2 n=1 Tax=Mizuhopecten yessoensis TaxID=6573 RepID=UPI000B459286|nr:nephrin-like isoform X2 [Mizuhopecten yessoensis]